VREYETVIVLDPAVGDAGAEEEIERIQGIITSRQGEIVGVERWGRRKLAYEINKKKEGIYALIRFGGTQEILAEIDRRCRLNESLMRHMTVISEGPPAPVVEPGVAPAEAGAVGTEPAGEGVSAPEPSE
jgi:small subunit ribosomal protein S6